MIKRFTYLICLLLVISCKQDSLSDLKKDTPIITAILESGSISTEVKLFYLGMGHPSIPINIQNAEMSLTSPNGIAVPLAYSNGVYRSAANSIDLQPGTTYNLITNISDEKVSAICSLPPPIALVDASNTSFIINTNSLGTPAFLLSWNVLDPDKYSYLLVLENLEENLVEIPFNVPSGNFTDQFSGPWEFNGATIYDTDFKYYGHHRLKVMAMEKSVESIYFYGPSDLRGLLQNGPDNVEGGRGYVFGLSSFTLDLWVQ